MTHFLNLIIHEKNIFFNLTPRINLTPPPPKIIITKLRYHYNQAHFVLGNSGLHPVMPLGLLRQRPLPRLLDAVDCSWTRVYTEFALGILAESLENSQHRRGLLGRCTAFPVTDLTKSWKISGKRWHLLTVRMYI